MRAHSFSSSNTLKAPKFWPLEPMPLSYASLFGFSLGPPPYQVLKWMPLLAAGPLTLAGLVGLEPTSEKLEPPSLVSCDQHFFSSPFLLTTSPIPSVLTSFFSSPAGICLTITFLSMP